jgi:peptide/nickel transport system permease protein
MIRYTIRRLLWGIVVILAVTFSVFLLAGPVLSWKNPGITPARLYAGKNPTPQAIQQVSQLLGLDKPFYVQYVYSVRRLVLGPSADEKARLCPGATASECSQLVGRLGRSFQKQRSVDTLILDRFPATLSLSLMAAFMWMVLSIPIGVLSAIKSRSFFDRSTMVTILVGQSLPVYYFGLLALYFFAYKIPIFPLGGYVPLDLSNPWPWFSHLVLPASILALTFAALYVRMVRGSMLTAMSEDYVRTARAKGAKEGRVITRHALRNAVLPIVTMFGLDLGLLLGGALLVEATFGIQGIGKLTIDAATAFDVPLLTGLVMFAALLIVVANILVDLFYAVVDPRIRLT